MRSPRFVRSPFLAVAVGVALTLPSAARADEKGYGDLCGAQLRDFLSLSLHQSPGTATLGCFQAQPAADLHGEGSVEEDEAAERNDPPEVQAKKRPGRRTRWIARAVRSPCFKGAHPGTFGDLPYEVVGPRQERDGWGFGGLHRMTFLSVLVNSLLGGTIDVKGEDFVALQKLVAELQAGRGDWLGATDCDDEDPGEHRELRKQIAAAARKVFRAHKAELRHWEARMHHWWSFVKDTYKLDGKTRTLHEVNQARRARGQVPILHPRTRVIAEMVRSAEFQQRHPRELEIARRTACRR